MCAPICASLPAGSDSLQLHRVWPPGCSVRETLQARTLDWAAMSFSRGLPTPGTGPRSPALKEIIYRLNPKEALGAGPKVGDKCQLGRGSSDHREK